MAEQALAGLKVVEYGEFISAAYCAKMMADLGAEVIRVESMANLGIFRRSMPFYGEESDLDLNSGFQNWNQCLLSATANLKKPKAIGRPLWTGEILGLSGEEIAHLAEDEVLY